MAKTLSTIIQNQLTNKDVKPILIFKINSTNFKDYLLDWSIDCNKEFGSAAATFTLNNNNGVFGEGGTYKINVGDTVEFIEKFRNDSTEFKKFYGIVNQRAIAKTSTSRVISLQCLDYISTLQFLDCDYVAEATKIEVEDETLTPNYLSSPNENMAQLFDFAHEAISDMPRPILVIEDKNTAEGDPQYDGFEIYYDVGQVKLGAPLNARYNYTLKASSYFYYPVGLYIEEIIEDILTLPDGYGGYLFGETSAANVITNHLTDTFYNVENKAQDTLTCNLTPSTITIRATLTQDYDREASGFSYNIIYVDDTTGFPNNGEANINGDIFTWTSKTTTSLIGIPEVGNYALKSHKTGSCVKYEHTYSAGQVWYLTYSNLITQLASGHFTIPGSTLWYLDKRYGRIILTGPISITSTVTCNTNYSFKTLQATGVELNRISFRPRETENRFEALNKLRSYLAPNYAIRTIGDNKIWASYLSQKTSYDYTLQLMTSLNYLEDEDLYTRVLCFAKNKNPTNIMYNDGISLETTGASYKSRANQIELETTAEETSHWVYDTILSGVGKITATTFIPKVWVNGVPIDDKTHRQTMIPVTIEVTTRTESTTTSGGK